MLATNHVGNVSQTTMRYHFISLRMAIVKKQRTSVGKEMEKLQPCTPLVGMEKDAASMKNSMKFLKN